MRTSILAAEKNKSRAYGLLETINIYYNANDVQYEANYNAYTYTTMNGVTNVRGS